MNRALHLFRAAPATLVVLFLTALSVRAQDPDDIYWDRRFPAIGINGTVSAVALLGTDVFFVGNFSEAGGLTGVQNVVRWNSTTYKWSRLGTGVRGQVFAVAALGQDVYVGGRFDQAGGLTARNIARFNLSSGTWSPVMDGATNGVDDVVRVLTAQNGALYVGGDFRAAGNLASPCLARYNPGGGTWERMITTIASFSVADPSVSAIAFNGADMYVGGEFDRIDGVSCRNVMRRISSGWDPLSSGPGESGLDGRVLCFAFRNNEVYIGGDFKQAVQRDTNLFLTSNICYWSTSDRRYQPLMPNGTNTNYNPRGSITSMLVWRGYLYAAGNFTDAGGAATGGFARYDFSRQRQAFNAVGGGIDGSAFALLEIPDGILLAGRFATAGNVAAAGAAIWNDVVYAPLTDVPDNGTNGPVTALASIGADLYVGGTFTVAGGRAARNVAQWDGTRWNSIGAGVDGPVYALVAVGADLYVGGSFANAGGVPAANIARYNTTTGAWSAVGGGLPGAVRSLVNHGGSIFAGGDFSNTTLKYIAQLNGSSWSSPGAGVSATVRCMVSVGGALYVGGDFTTAGGVSAAHAARWTGSAWQGLGTGLTGGTGATAYAMSVDGSDVIVGGNFSDAGGIGSPFIARWSTALNAWGGLGPGAGKGPCDIVRAIAVDGSHIYFGGAFLLAGNTSVNYVADYDGSGFTYLGGTAENGVNDSAFTMHVSNGTLYVGGIFTSTADGFANRIARYTGSSWGPLGGTITAGLNGIVHALVIDGDAVYVGGAFTGTGTSTANRVIRWNNATGSWSTLGSGLDGPVYALAVAAGKLYVAGSFSVAGGIPMRNIAVWDLSRRRWEYLGDVRDNGVDGPIHAIAVDAERVYVGGEFKNAGDSSGFNRFAAWDLNGRTWVKFANGADSTVRAIGISGQNVYVGGDFFRMDGLPASHIARWEKRNKKWQRLGAGMNASVNAIAVEGNDVYLGGDFATAGTISAPHVVRWDNATDFYDYVGTDGIGGGWVEATVNALAVRNGVLYVGGEFYKINADSGYNNVARWNKATKTWKRFGSGITGDGTAPAVYAVAADDNNFFTGGLFDRAGDVGSYYIAHWEGPINRPSEVDVPPIVDGSIGQPIPNPAVDQARFALRLDRSTHIRIELVNALGHVVRVVTDDVMNEGEHVIPCDVRDLPSGLYLLKASDGVRIDARRLVVAR